MAKYLKIEVSRGLTNAPASEEYILLTNNVAGWRHCFDTGTTLFYFISGQYGKFLLYVNKAQMIEIFDGKKVSTKREGSVFTYSIIGNDNAAL